ncbi:XRE family transcriptional regulator [Anaerococcus vaginalis]|nr:XRE family transcriptional regulator [Anaerococcus vaginalis]MDU6547861.1 XRE family transcriptional regulator [Anaerococcus vaginalis]
MTEKNLNNGTLAELMGVSRQWLGVVFQRGYATPKIINKLAKALEVEVENIVKMED